MMDISMYGNHSHTSGFQSPDLGSTGYPYFSGHHHHHHHSHHMPPHSNQIHTQNSIGYSAAQLNINPNNSSVNAASVIPSSATNASNHLYSAASTHPHLYSPSAIEYGITTSANNSPSEQYYETSDGVYYNNSGSTGGSNNSGNNGGSPMPENHIISSDNGLSYTNLDYITYQQTHGNQAGYSMIPGADEKIHIPHHFNEDLMIANGQTHHHHHSAQNNNLWHHPHSQYMESPTTLPTQLNIAAMQGNPLQNQQQMNHSLHSPSGIQSAQSTSPSLLNQQAQQQQAQQAQQQQQQHQQQQNVPTYKWMQVKRNVPKPQSE